MTKEWSKGDSVEVQWEGQWYPARVIETGDRGFRIPEYIELLLRSRGFWYWQLALCVDEQQSPDFARFREIMPSLFPDYDDALFRPGTEDGSLNL